MTRFANFARPRTRHRRPLTAAVALASAAGLTAVLPAAAHDNGGHEAGSHSAGRHEPLGSVHGRTLVFQSPLSDLQPSTTQPLEGASATLRLTLGQNRSAFVLKLRGIDREAAGTTYGAHLHSGTCVPGDGAAAGPHYNSATPPVIDDDHEVWLDFTVTRGGTGRATAVVPFVPVHGARSVVIHEKATDHGTGAAGGRLACMPVVW
jgi:Cu/Zn superoxide dismutase